MSKSKLLKILSAIVIVSVLASLALGFKLYAYGKDVEITYCVVDVLGVAKSTQTVQVGKKYQLEIPSDISGEERVFLYWTTVAPGEGNPTKGKVKQSGTWFLTATDVELYAFWSGDSWSGIY